MRSTLLLMLLLGALAPASAEPLRFEAEDWTTPTSAWQIDQYSEDLWNLWSTDRDAAGKWSGGVVLQSPRVLADRERPEDGAPPLHTVITGLPPGTYDVFMNRAPTRTLAISFDGQTWQPSAGGLIAANLTIDDDGRFELWVDDRYVHASNPGSVYYDYLQFDPVRPFPAKPQVSGHATTRVVEPLDRGLVAVTGPAGVFLSWRLLPDDPADLGFNLYRAGASGAPVRVNAAPVVQTTDLLDPDAPATGPVRYEVRPVREGQEGGAEGWALRQATDFVSQPLDGDQTFQKLGLGDLDGDGRLDYVIKRPGANIDPYIKYWKPSPGTYVLEAWTHDGQKLWEHDLGWSIEQGIWYSPYLVYDFDGDGRAEVAVKVGEGDPRDADGRVTTGGEWVAILDGLTGAERCRAPWPGREGFGEGDSGYNYASRNQLAVAYLDGRTPCLITLRGTYTLMRADAWEFVDNALRPLWSYSSDEGSRRLRGQGAHFTQAADLDGDGRDEVILGSVVLDDNGVPLWNVGLGHPDAVYVGDLDPARPGLEMYYGVETAQPKNGMAMVDATTGEILWGYDRPTPHIHASGICSDLDPTSPGAEMYGMNSVGDHEVSGESWLWSATGELLAANLSWGFSKWTAWWDADLQREILFGSELVKYQGRAVPGWIEGRVVLVADLLGDWREEIVTALPGELRIYTTTIPAMDRRPTLLSDPLYRQTTAMLSMGYTQVPTLRTCLEAESPNLNLTVLDPTAPRFTPVVDAGTPATGAAAPAGDAPAPAATPTVTPAPPVPAGGPGPLRLVVSAPRDRGVSGTLTLTADRGEVAPGEFAVTLAPGERTVLSAAATVTGEAMLTARLAGPAVDLTVEASVAQGLRNGGFEAGGAPGPVGWVWWSRENTGGATVDRTAPRTGRASAAVVHDGERDWAFTNRDSLPVGPGTRLTARGWAKNTGTGAVELAIVARYQGQTVTWRLAHETATGPFDWRAFAATVTVPEGVDEVALRWAGHGAVALWLDDVELIAGE